MRATSVVFVLLAGLAQCTALLGQQALRGTAVAPSVAQGGDRDEGADRETQSPIVWLRLHKTVLNHATPSWHDVSFAEQAAQRQGELNIASRTSP